jgi:hypothetical protein
MAEARISSEWDRYAALMTLTANLQIDRKKQKPFDVSDFHPLLKKPKPKKSDVSILKELFVNGAQKKV